MNQMNNLILQLVVNELDRVDRKTPVEYIKSLEELKRIYKKKYDHQRSC